MDDLPPDTTAFAAKCFDMARKGNTATLEAYITAGLPANLTNDQGNTLLMLAAYNGHTDTVKTLAEKGADVNRLNDKGQSPMAGAVFKGEEAVVRLLFQLGADPSLGEPSAVETARIFNQRQYEDIFGSLTAAVQEESRSTL